MEENRKPQQQYSTEWKTFHSRKKKRTMWELHDCMMRPVIVVYYEILRKQHPIRRQIINVVRRITENSIVDELNSSCVVCTIASCDRWLWIWVALSPFILFLFRIFSTSIHLILLAGASRQTSHMQISSFVYSTWKSILNWSISIYYEHRCRIYIFMSDCGWGSVKKLMHLARE